MMRPFVACQLLEWELLSSGMVLRGWSARV